jgi:hypothetical protein
MLFVAIMSLLGFFVGGFLGQATNPIEFSADCDRLTIGGVSAYVGLAAGCVFALIGYLVFRADPEERDLRFMVPALFFIGAFFWCLGLGLYLNEALDSGQTTRYAGLIVVDMHEYSPTEGGSTYHVEMKAPPEDTCSPTWRVKLEKDLYEAAKAGRTRVAVDVKPGAFGFPWVKKVSIVK